MGYPIGRFEEEPDKSVICQICLGVFKDAVIDGCGHVFCEDCILPWIEREEKCPISYKPTANLLKDSGKRDKINAMRIKCRKCNYSYTTVSRYEEDCSECSSEVGECLVVNRMQHDHHGSSYASQTSATSSSDSSDVFQQILLASAVVAAGLMILR